jgi:hypothetical protein
MSRGAVQIHLFFEQLVVIQAAGRPVVGDDAQVEAAFHDTALDGLTGSTWISVFTSGASSSNNNFNGGFSCSWALVPFHV